MKKFTALLTVLFMSMASFLTACTEQNETTSSKGEMTDDGLFTEPIDMGSKDPKAPTAPYVPNHLLAKKAEGSFPSIEKLSALGVESFKEHSGTDWYTLVLKDGKDASEIISAVRSSKCFSMVDYDYIFENKDDRVGTSTSSGSQEELGVEDVVDLDAAYSYLEERELPAGGDSSVVVAVLDTGVDYNHEDLRDNIWTNTAEIPDNGIDDDGNGYVDDVHGWNFVGNNNDPSDDNGHGTHVAGIIAAEDNDRGTRGIAYNATIMPVKCGNSSGYFNNSDIAKAVTYAYMNGADIINMSFGGSAISIEVQEALKQAYTTSFLVASAGNDGAQNELVLNPFDYPVIPTYPAAFPFVCGVMSMTNSYVESLFTNFDPNPHNNVEYEVYAPGEAVYSTFPGNRYASLSGTSMSAPVVSGIAALLRTAYPDREAYPTKYLFSQLTDSSSLSVQSKDPEEKNIPGYPFAPCVDAGAALTKEAPANVQLYDYWTFDNKGYSSANNGNKTINNGESIRIGLDLMNYGGVATDVSAHITTLGGIDGTMKDPYYYITKDTIDFGMIGIYSEKDTGLVKDKENEVVDTEDYFEIKIAEDCPDNYAIRIPLSIQFTDKKTGDEHSVDTDIMVSVSNRVQLPSVITEDTTLTNEHSYLLSGRMTIQEGVTLTIEEGVDVQVYADDYSDYSGIFNSPSIIGKGSLVVEGSVNQKVNFHVSQYFSNYAWKIEPTKASLKNAVLTNCFGYINSLESCTFNLLARNYYLNGNNTTLYSFGSNTILDCILNIKTYVGFGCRNFSENQLNIFSGDIRTYYWNLDQINSSVIAFFVSDWENMFYSYRISNSVFVNKTNSVNASFSLHNSTILENNELVNFHGVTFSDFFDDNSLISENIVNENVDPASRYPYVTDVSLYNASGEKVEVISKENATVKISFNRDMDTTLPLDVTYGSVEPFADYVVEGSYENPRLWVGTIHLEKINDAMIESGIQHFSITNARAADNYALVISDMGSIFTFEIDLTSALAMNLRATPRDDGILLEWDQDDYDTLMGYNVYRSEEENGQYVRLNRTTLAVDETSFLDTDAEPGKTYYYQFTVVLTDMSESKPSGRTVATMVDTIAPTVYHTPVNQGYVGNNLVISVTASDNVAVKEASLFYRTKGEETYKKIAMNRSNDRFTAKINGSELSLAGLEYYIEVSDGVNVISKGSADDPYQVVIKDASLLSGKGDVNADGVIDTMDTLMMMQSLEGKLILTDDQFQRADINDSGKIETIDIYAVMNYINGSINSLDDAF